MTQADKFPTHIDLTWPTLLALKQLGGSGTIEEIFDKMVEIQQFPESIQQVPASRGNRSKLEYRAAWARSYLKLVGAVENSQVGVWSITPLGEAIAQEELLAKLKAVNRDYYQKRKEGKEAAVADQDDSEESIVDELLDDWRAQLLNVLKAIDPSAFERLCQRVLRESGFTKVEVTGRSGDGGIDGVGVLRVNLLSFQVSFQCKRYAGSVGSGVVRDFRGAMIGRCDKGLIISTGSFTSEARKEATRDGAPAIDLIDGDELCDLLKRLKLGVETKLIEQVEVTPDWFGAL